MNRRSLIEIDSLVKRFWHKDSENRKTWKAAVDGLSLSVGEGEIFGLLGPNGAGKTTTIRVLTMQTEATEGRVLYDGKELSQYGRELKELIGVVPQHVNFDQDLTVGENMELHARLHHMGSEARRKRIEELLRYVELGDVVNDGVRQLSGGMKRRLLIVRALIHHPRIFFLDEPTVALDPQVRRRIWDLIRQMARDGVTVFLTTHYIEEAEALCDRVAIMNKGKLAGMGEPAELCRRLGRHAVEWDDGRERKYRFFSRREEAAAFAARMDAPEKLLVRRTNLEDVFIELTGRREGL